MNDASTQAALAAANAELAKTARADVIQVELERVVASDPTENIPDRTVREQVTNHQLTVSDRLGMYQQPGWHGLGTVIPEEYTGRQAVERFLGWSVVPQETFTTWGEGDSKKQIKLPLKANVRSDTGEVLGIVGPNYSIIQNADLGSFADALLEESKLSGVGVRMETCGSLLAGRKVFLTMRPDRDIRVGRNGDDVTVPLLTLLNGHDGAMAFTACWSFVRVVCNNTFTSALGNVEADVNAGRAFKIRHSGKAQDYLQQAKAALGIAVKGLEKYQEVATAMAGKQVGRERMREFFEDCYAEVFGRPEESPTTDAERDAARKRDAVVGEWIALMGHENQLIPGMAGTLWACFNAVTQWQDHTRAARIGTKDGRRDHLKLFGQGAIDKRKAFRAAVEFLSA